MLQEEGFIGEACSDGETALALTEKQAYAVILVGWVRAEWDGLLVCRMLRAAGIDRPLLVVLASGGPEECSAALQAGADDYIAEPFALDELIWRLHALVRRSLGIAQLKVGPLEIDAARHRVSLAGELLNLTSREYAFLLHLAYHADRPISRAELFAQVWHGDAKPSMRPTQSTAIAVIVNYLREKFGEYRWMICTVPRVGYKLCSTPTR
jgi:two-component system OmpR family response regulator